jgi:hypothetical protein
MSFLSFTCARNSKGNAGSRRLSLGAQSDIQLALKGLGPEDGDRFRFTWHNTRIGDAVWIEHRGSWRPGVVVGRGRKRVMVAIEADGWKRLIVTKFYCELRRRREGAH